jgi:DNA-directed RNA polymerase specialized sigma24 family protein
MKATKHYELCTTGNNPSIHNTDEFIGLWHKMSRRRAIDFYHHYGKRFDMEIYDTMLEINGKRDAPYERDLFHLQPGTKRATYLRMRAEGNTPTEIANECGCSLSTVSASICRSIQFLQRYFKKEQGL